MHGNIHLNAPMNPRGLCPYETKSFALGPTEQELHILWAQLLHGDGIIVDSPVDHVRLLLLQEDHTRLDRVFNAKSRDDTGALLSDTVAAVGGLPFCGRIPPSVDVSLIHCRREKGPGTGAAK